MRRGRSMVCESTLACPQPPVGSRGRGPWSGRGSQRVKPRLVSPFEKRRLLCKGQKFLRVDDPKARPYLLRWQRAESWRSLGSLCSLGMTDIVRCRDGRVRVGIRWAAGIPGWQRSWFALKTSYDDKKVSHHRAAGGRLRRGRSMVCEGGLTPAPSPPSGSRGRGPWSGRGSQRVKPRLVSPFEKRRLLWQRTKIPSCRRPQGKALPSQSGSGRKFRAHDPSARAARSG